MIDAGEWGYCAAHGCPLFGSLGGSPWYCFCHHGRPNGANDAITQCLRNSEATVVALTKAIRADSISGAKSEATAIALRELKAHPMAGELSFNRSKDGNARAWLLRLERHLLDATAEFGRQQGLSGMVPTAPIIGPTHALDHYQERAE
ncbi:hypothetical protein AB1286_20095 [Trinickia sp. NRRL B-1857]|uniref:hypothetical protein n=1 Tax=Trinickia sp. NRRL B-1857 TaxID=3162879 RepID=UPI003D27D50E